MSKRHTIYVIVDKDGKFVDACLSYSEAMLKAGGNPYGNAPRLRIKEIRDREDY